MRDTSKLCHSDFCEGLLPHSHNLSQTNTSLDRLLQKCPSPSFFTRENQFKRLDSQTYRVSRETTDKANEYRNKQKLGVRIASKTKSPSRKFHQRTQQIEETVFSPFRPIHGSSKDYRYYL